MKILPKLLLASYLFILLWLVLFKFSLDIPEALAHNNMRLLNLVPFANYSAENIRELIYNFLVFIPFGLFLSVNLKSTFMKRLVVIFLFSLSVETIQYMSALGAADITDLISNTAGGLLGLALYEVGNKLTNTKELDQYITVGGSILLVSSVAFLGALFASGVRIESQHQRTNDRELPPMPLQQ